MYYKPFPDLKTAYKQFPLKDRKSARLKLRILESTLDLMGTGPFREISVDQIADRAEISRGTLFNYFPQKKEIMFYYFEIWNFHRSVEQLQKPLTGVRAIERLFQQSAVIYKKRPGVALSVLSFIADLREKPQRIAISPAERRLLYPSMENIERIEILQLYERFNLHVEEALQAKNINTSLSKKDIVNLLETIWYGGFMVAHMSGKDIESVYKSNLKWLKPE